MVPPWYSAPYWPLLFPDGQHPAEFIKEVVVLPPCESLILPGTSGSSLFRGMPNTELWALWLDFGAPGEAEYVKVAKGWIIRIFPNVSMLELWDCDLEGCIA